MICELKNVELLSSEEDTFHNEKTGKDYPYARGSFIQSGSVDPIIFSIDYELYPTLQKRGIYDLKLEISAYNNRLRHKVTDAVAVDNAY